MGSESWF